MEEAVSERPTSQELQNNQHQTCLNGSVGPSDTDCPNDSSHNWYSGGNILPQDKGHTSVCRDFTRGNCFRGRLCKYQHSLHGEQERSVFGMCRDFIKGNCTYGESCKFRHFETDKHDGNRSYGNENSGNFVNLGKPQFREVNKDDNLKSFLPREHRSTAPCWKFLSGRCFRGADCAYSHSENSSWNANLQQGVVQTESDLSPRVDNRAPHEHDGASKENDSYARPHFGHYRSRSPCRNFLRGRCNNGTYCRHLHIENTGYVRSMDDKTSPKFNNGCVDVALRTSQENKEVNNEPRSRSPCRKFLRGSCLRGSSCPYMHPNMHDKHKFDYSGQHHQGLTYVKHAPDDMDLASRNRSSGGQGTRTHGEFGNSTKIKEFCLKFAKGRCDRGDSCRYLHSFHEYAKSNPESNKEHHSDNIATLGSSNGAHYHVGNGDGAIDEPSKRPFVDDSLNSNVLDQKGEADCDISLWSQPFKKRRSWSESPSVHNDDFRHRSARRIGFQNSFTRDPNYNLVPFQHYHRGSYHHSRSRYNLDNRPHSKVTTSMDLPLKSNLCSDSHLTKTLDTCNGICPGECGAGSLDSNNSVLHQNVDISEGQIGANPKEVEFKSSNPSEYGTSLRKNDGEVSIDLSQEGGETTSITCSDPIMQGPSSSSLNCANDDSVTGASNDMKSTVNICSVDNGETTNIIQHNVEPSTGVIETPGSLIKGSNLKFKGKLLILDVNGILADIVADYPETFKPDTMVSMKGVFKRPFCDDFLEFCFERFDVGVWSSRNKKNVDKVTDFLMGDSKKNLLFCWDQSYCTDTGYKTVENRDKPLVLKELRRLWEKQVDDLPWEEGYYNETNTILLDDSPYKALRNPPYTAVFPFPFTFRDSKDTDLGPNGKLRLYLEGLSKADNVQKFIQENPFGQRPITKSNLSWRFYSKIV